MEHHSEALNREEPSHPVRDTDMVEPTGLEEIEMGRIKPDEVNTALKLTKREKAPGVDGVSADLQRADEEGSGQVLIKLLNVV